MQTKDWTLEELFDWLNGESHKNWRIGDVALKIAPKGKRGAGLRLLWLAHDLGIAPSSVKLYRDVASMWPADKRNPKLTWQAHAALSYQPDRFELINRPEGWSGGRARAYRATQASAR